MLQSSTHLNDIHTLILKCSNPAWEGLKLIQSLQTKLAFLIVTPSIQQIQVLSLYQCDCKILSTAHLGDLHIPETVHKAWSWCTILAHIFEALETVLPNAQLTILAVTHHI
jgi:hypothetical protein